MNKVYQYSFWGATIGGTWAIKSYAGQAHQSETEICGVTFDMADLLILELPVCMAVGFMGGICTAIASEALVQTNRLLQNCTEQQTNTSRMTV